MSEYELQLNKCALEVSELFTAKKLTLAIAESFTGGTIAASVVKIAGASSYFLEGAGLLFERSQNAEAGSKSRNA